MAKNELYAFYDPSLAGSVIVMALYLFSTVFALWQAFHNKTPLLFFLLFGSGLEAVAFIGRTYSITHEQDIWGFLLAYALPVVAPSLIAASCYQILGRIVWATTPLDRLNARHIWAPPRFIAPIFCLLELFAFLIQVVGAITVGSALNPSNQELTDTPMATDSSIFEQPKIRNGTSVMEVGVILHLACLCLFVLFSLRFMLLSRSYKPSIQEKWTRLLWAVTGASAFLTVQAVFRSFEFVKSPSVANLATEREWCFYLLDSTPVLLALLLVHVVHPGKHLPHHFVGFHLDKNVTMQQKRNEAAGSQGHSMYVDPERGHSNAADEDCKPPPGYAESCDEKDSIDYKGSRDSRYSLDSKDVKHVAEHVDDGAVEFGKISN